MATSSRKPKISSSGRSSITFRSNIDRISKLPDSLLCEILSFLPTRLAVSTSILSKRWRFLWTWVLNLDFDGNKREVDFASIVNRVLLLRREWGIRRFRFSRHSGIYPPLNADSWVSTAISRGVQELDFELMPLVVLPRSLFYCKTLLVLKLIGHGQALDVPSSAILPNLKTLHLQSLVFKDEDSSYNLFLACPLLLELDCIGLGHWKKNPVKFHFANRDCLQKLVILRLSNDIILSVASNVHFPSLEILRLERIVYKDESSAHNLISCCPVLRDLYVERSDEDNILCYEISSATLRRLVYIFTVWKSLSSYTLRVNTPALKYLSIDDCATQRFYIENIGRLDTPTVCNSNDFLGFQALCHVTSLDLDNSVKPICNMSFFDELPEFHNLIELRFKKFCCCGGLLHMLWKFPRLERLTLYKWTLAEVEDGEVKCKMPTAPQLLHSPNCLGVHLRTLSFSDFEGMDVEMEFMRYMLKNSLVLEQVSIYAALRLDSDRRFADLQKLSGFERGSNKCKLSFL